MYKAVGFDLGGVLVFYAIPRELGYIAKHLGRPLPQVNRAFHKLRPLIDVGRIDNMEFWRRFLIETGSDADPEATEHLWTDNYVQGNPLVEGMLELVDGLKRNGYKVGILSNIDPEHAKINYGRHIFEHFDQVLLSDEIGVRKPEPGAFAMLCQRLEVEPGELVFTDDLPENIAGAKRCGITAIQFCGRPALTAELKRLGIKA